MKKFEKNLTFSVNGNLKNFNIIIFKFEKKNSNRRNLRDFFSKQSVGKKWIKNLIFSAVSHWDLLFSKNYDSDDKI